jgi:hypothetical protein
MNLFTEFKSVFKTPAPLQVAANELALAELELLSAESAVQQVPRQTAQGVSGFSNLR